MYNSLTLFLVLLVSSLFGQSDKLAPDEIMFETAYDYFDKENYDSALVVYNKFMIDHPKSTLIPRAHFNIGYINHTLGQMDTAIIVYKNILRKDYDDQEPYGGLMEQYALFKHRSAECLAEIYLDRKDYKSAKMYIYLFDKVYPYQHFCGNELAAYDIYRDRTYAKIYLSQGKFNKARNTLLEHIFYNDLANNQGAVDDLMSLLETYYSDEAVKAELVNARQSLALKSNDRREFATIKLFGKKIKVEEGSIYDISNPKFDEHVMLTGLEKYQQILAINPIFKKYEIP